LNEFWQKIGLEYCNKQQEKLEHIENQEAYEKIS
jgi:hypothetical protein